MNIEETLEPLFAHFYIQNHSSPSFQNQSFDPSNLVHVDIDIHQDEQEEFLEKKEQGLKKKKISRINNRLSEKERKQYYLQKLKQRYLYHNMNLLEKIVHNKIHPIISRKYIEALKMEIDRQEGQEVDDLNTGIEKLNFNQKIAEEENSEKEIIQNIDNLEI